MSVKIALVGECEPHPDDKSNFILNNMLTQVGIARSDCYSTNVFSFYTRDVIAQCGGKAERLPGTTPLVKGKYVRAEFASEIERLKKELANVRPNVIVALGATAAWALLGTSGIKKIRGAADWSDWGYKIVPTYNAGAVAREWTLRPIVLADLSKALRESSTPDLVRPSRAIWIEPTLQDLETFEERYVKNCTRLSIDIETKGRQITCIGFAPSPSIAIVIPFYSELRPKNNYWETALEEKIAWKYVKRWCETYPSVFQNGLYDINFLWTEMGIRCLGAEHDTMLLHHAEQPELEKGLGFLGSVYTDEASWKFMRKKAEGETNKRED